MADLEPVYVGGHVVAYRPAAKSAPKKTSAKKAAETKAAASPASKAEEAKS